MFSKKPEVIK